MEENTIKTCRVFSSDLLDCMRHLCVTPDWVGNPVFDKTTGKLAGLLPRNDGSLKLWFKRGINNEPTIGPFTVGCNIAAGGVSEHSQSSVITAIDNRTGEQVLEYKAKGIEPRVFASIAVGLCVWLRNALLSWEDSGVSGGFAKEVIEVLQYGNVFYRDVTQLGSQKKKSRKPGWPCRDADKADMFELMALAMENGGFVPRSEEMIAECGEYAFNRAKIVHSPENDMEAADKNHGERALSAAGCLFAFNSGIIVKIDTSDKITWFVDANYVKTTACRLIGNEDWHNARRLLESVEMMVMAHDRIQESSQMVVK